MLVASLARSGNVDGYSHSNHNPIEHQTIHSRTKLPASRVSYLERPNAVGMDAGTGSTYIKKYYTIDFQRLQQKKQAPRQIVKYDLGLGKNPPVGRKHQKVIAEVKSEGVQDAAKFWMIPQQVIKPSLIRPKKEDLTHTDIASKSKAFFIEDKRTPEKTSQQRTISPVRLEAKSDFFRSSVIGKSDKNDVVGRVADYDLNTVWVEMMINDYQSSYARQ